MVGSAVIMTSAITMEDQTEVHFITNEIFEMEDKEEVGCVLVVLLHV